MAPGDKISTGKSVAHMLLRGLLTLLLIFVIAGIILAVSVTAFIFSLRNSSVDFDLQKLKLNYTSFIYVNGPNDDKNHPVKYQSLYSTENRVWVDYDKIPQNMGNAVIAIEDKRFLEHNGVDWWRTLGAAASLFHIGNGQSGYGGSTITQQLIKNLTGENQVSLTRKITEIFRAMNLEQKYSKQEILTAYLNDVNFGSGCNGVESAANTYFNKSIKDCDLAQCAAIAGITQNPTAYNPLLHPEANKKRQQTVLTAMHDQKKITDAEYQSAIAESNHMQFYTNKKAAVVDENAIWNWYTDALFEDVKQGLMKAYNCSESNAIELIYHGGLHIYSAVNTEMQNDAESVFNDGKTFPSDSPNLQGGYVSMDYSGRVMAIVGGRGKKTLNRAYNLATDAKRQPGSSIKPLAVYGPAVNLGKITYSSLVNDEPQPDWFGKGRPGPRNWDSPTTTYHGMIPTELALDQSYNAAAINIFKMVTPKVGLDFMRQKLGFTSIENSDYNLSSGIGGLTYGATVREMTAGFQIFGNGGKYYKPYTYYYVTDHDGNVISGMDNRSETSTQAISSSSATIMNKLLASVMQPGNTGEKANVSGWQVFGKTGTTDSDKDLWFVGGTPYAVAGIWTGYTSPRSVKGGPALNAAKRVWKAIMTKYLDGKSKKDFQFDSNVVSASFDEKTGLLVPPGSANAGTGWYDKNNMPAAGTATAGISSGSVSGGTVVGPSSSSQTAMSGTESPASSNSSSAASSGPQSEPESQLSSQSGSSSSSSLASSRAPNGVTRERSGNGPAEAVP